jgi:hypothetical protein
VPDKTPNDGNVKPLIDPVFIPALAGGGIVTARDPYTDDFHRER